MAHSVFRNIDMHKAVGQVLLFFCLLPYLAIIPLPTDIQPYALSLAVVYVLMNHREEGVGQFKVVMFLMFVALAFVFDPFNFLQFVSIRSFSGYLSFFVISYAAYIYIQHYGIPTDLIKGVILIWFFFGFVQLFVSNSFGSFLIADFRFSDNRGVNSLAPEASYYGLMCIFLFFLSHYVLKSTKYAVLSGIQVIFLSQSSMAVIVFVVYLFLIVFFRLRFFMRVLVVSLGVITLVGGYFFLSKSPLVAESRLLQILQLIVLNPLTFFQLDASINDRLGHIFLSFKGAFDNALLPHGYNAWPAYVNSEIIESENFHWLTSGRIMCTYGAVLFELGVFGLIVPLVLNWSIIGWMKHAANKDMAAFLVTFNLLMLLSVPLAFPLISILMAIGFYQSQQSKTA